MNWKEKRSVVVHKDVYDALRARWLRYVAETPPDPEALPFEDWLQLYLVQELEIER